MWKAFNVKEEIKIISFFSFFCIKRKNGFHFRGESHNFWECMYVRSGNLCATAGNKIFNLAEGDIIFFKPLEFHKYYVTGKSADICIFSFSLEKELPSFGSVFSATAHQKKLLEGLISYMSEVTDSLNAPSDNDSFIRFLYPFDKVSGYSQTVAAEVCKLLHSLCGFGKEVFSEKSPEAVTYGNAVKFLTENINEQVSVSALSHSLGVSESAVKRLFSKYAGVGIHKFFLTMKINRATVMLKEGFSVTETAERLGFSGQGYFSAVYKRETGQNPSEIKNKNI